MSDALTEATRIINEWVNAPKGIKWRTDVGDLHNMLENLADGFLELESELKEQCRLNGTGGNREAALEARYNELNKSFIHHIDKHRREKEELMVKVERMGAVIEVLRTACMVAKCENEERSEITLNDAMQAADRIMEGK